jgi:DNA-binding response OmpR family regulator
MLSESQETTLGSKGQDIFTQDARGGALEAGGLRVDPDAHEATLDGAPLDLSPREFDLLLYLAQRPGQVVTRRDLLTHVWQLPYGGADKTVDVHVSWLRRKLGETAQEPRYLHTVRGVGIKLSPPTGTPGPLGPPLAQPR